VAEARVVSVRVDPATPASPDARAARPERRARLAILGEPSAAGPTSAVPAAGVAADDDALPFAVAPDSAALDAKLEALRAWFTRREAVIVAYSGGVDSAFVLAVAAQVLGARARAFTARSPSLLAVELDEARALAAALGVAHEIVDTHELERPGYVANAPSRCYFCKTELFDATAVARARAGDAVVVDGFNVDDLGDHRPGHRAAAEHGVLHPLAEVGLTKAEVRALSRRLGLPTWRKPQLACLASRIPYGVEVTAERLERIGAVETAVRALGFFDVRARLVAGTDALVRLELGAGELLRAVERRAELVAAGRAAGFAHVTLDLEPFRSGRMNDALRAADRAAPR
jgi:uncharacterized protein